MPHLALLQVAGDAAHRELQTGLAAPGDSLLGRLSLSAARHGCWVAGLLCECCEEVCGFCRPLYSLYFSFSSVAQAG